MDKLNCYKNFAICDLHLHLDGALSSEVIIKIAQKEGIDLPTYYADELQKYLCVGPECKSLNDYLEKFKIPNLVLQSEYGLTEATKDLLDRLSQQGIKYVEIRMAPQLSTNKGLSQEEVVRALLKVIKKSEKVFKVKSRLILCMMRGSNNRVENIETIRVAKEFLGKGVVAIDLAGAEALYPNENFKEELLEAKVLGVPFIIHAGEASGYLSVESALDLGAVRIGHGIHALENEATIKRLAINKIPLEVCITSNLDTKAVNSLKEIRIKELLDKGVIITINTDDPTVSKTTLAREYELLKELGLSNYDVYKIVENTIASSFLSDKEKIKLKEYIK